MDNNKKGRMFSSTQRKAFAIAFSIIFLFTTGYALGVFSSVNVNMPMKEQPVVATTEVTTTETTTVPTTVPTTEATTTTEAPTTTTAPSTTAAASEPDSICDMIRGVLGTIFPCLAEESAE